MPKIFIDETERFPELIITAPPVGKNGVEVFVSPEKLAKWNAAISAFEEVQKEMILCAERRRGVKSRRTRKANPRDFPPPPPPPKRK